ncbi:hypothetical protein CYMTET_43888 [Cymbomonas tetramitiformis]|uniref:DNA/pantothenate metabolism flavoprotein C-terminal domain-containing protein n=1 Tax=Cymbomonas tetramitiformis TaxID=36881 RepID=A0AAE0C2J3_9CHLO|nr:hypothetical protein CYMTET_43892 [Cymbomonas tetramitiformis]KAK3246579.1 hypothetical protein CYMTET_43888 [Cymbomonas tetramitiformis]
MGGRGSQPEHKIQSRDLAASQEVDVSEGLNLHLDPVPKMLGALRKEWAPQAFHVSFKLETDEEILAYKAVGALRKYDLHCVVANELHTRKDRVILISLNNDDVGVNVRTGGGNFALKGAAVKQLITRPEGEEDIERSLVANITHRHMKHYDPKMAVPWETDMK